MTLQSHIDDLDPEDRPVAREWGEMESAEFQARMGPEISRLASVLARRSRWYNLRLSEIARIGVAAALAVVGKGSL